MWLLFGVIFGCYSVYLVIIWSLSGHRPMTGNLTTVSPEAAEGRPTCHQLVSKARQWDVKN